MTPWHLVGAVLAVALGSGAVRAQSPVGERDPGAEVRSVFAAKCAGCHGPDLPRPQGRFGYVLDLRRVAGNPEMVIPGRPEESELWLLVSHGDMPPAGAPHGPLGAAEKELVRAWIAAGAPEARTRVPDPAPSADPAPPSPARRTVRLLGKFHLLLLHFPIALLIAAAVGEFLPSRGSHEPSAVVRFCLTLAAAAVVPTVALGWLHAWSGNGVGAPQYLSAHRCLGTITGVWVIFAAWCSRRDARRGARSSCGRIALAVSVLLVVATAHAGGLLAHGREFFDW
ncbi:MAG: hypothetical protein J0I06_10910 [Planctomycetes bacterium]|nr:hypothetical protein [Planctomycetota bacterium]